jgi:serine/threonine protein kinase
MAQPEELCMGCMEPRAGIVCALCGWTEGSPPVSPIFLPPRTVLDERYLLGRVLGAGGFGITYLAWDLNLDLKLAVKEYFPNAFGARDRDSCTVIAANTQSKGAFDHGLAKFQDEGRSLARFQGHPSIASVMTFFRENGTAYLVMRFEDGITLKEYLEKNGGRMDAQTAMKIAMPVMDALRAVHHEGILHRDISPDNIIINSSGQIKILDFGSAKRDMTSQDRTLQITLKPGFSPEEQYRANGRQGPWTDVYAVGATLYQCLTGAKPPDALERLNADTLRPPSQLGIEIPKNCEKALMKALAVRSADRFQTIEEFQKAFVVSAPIPAPPRPLRRRQGPILAGLRDWPRRHMRVLVWAGGAALTLFTVILIVRVLAAVPQIRQFTADPSAASSGQAATLRWSVAGGTVSITPGIGRISQNTGSRQVTPSSSTTYTLTASGLIRSVSRTAKVTVTGQAIAIAFTADPLTIEQGASTELVWSVPGNASVTIDQGIGAVKSSDRVTLKPAADTTYTLRAEGPGGVVAQASVTVQIAVPVPKPVIVSLSANPLTIRKGQSAQLTWAVSGNNALASFDQSIGSVKLQDSRSVSPELTTKYKLLARNPGGAVSKYVTVEVVQPATPRIVSFRAAPESIAYRQNATLSWSVTGEADSITINPNIGTVRAEDSVQVSPPGTTTYSISATGPGGTATGEAVVNVVTRTPAILAFTATPPVVAPEHGVILHWNTDGDVDTVTIQPGAIRPKGDHYLVTPSANTRYTLTVSGPGGTKSEFVDVQVKKERFEIVSFEVQPQKIKRGESATISWKVNGPVTDLSIAPAVGKQGKTGSITVTPDRDTVYALTARSGEQSLTATAKIQVKKK